MVFYKNYTKKKEGSYPLFYGKHSTKNYFLTTQTLTFADTSEWSLMGTV